MHDWPLTAISSNQEIYPSNSQQLGLEIGNWLNYLSEQEMLSWNESSQNGDPTLFSPDIFFQGQQDHNSESFCNDKSSDNPSMLYLSEKVSSGSGHDLEEREMGTHQPRCMEVILSLPHRQYFKDLITRFLNAVYPVVPILHALKISSIYKNVCELVNSWGEDVESLSLHFSSNFCSTSIVVPGGKPSQRGSSRALCLSANDISWDVFAALLAVYGLAGLSLAEWDPMWSSEEQLERKTFAVKMLASLDKCLGLGQNAKANEMRVSAMYLGILLQIQLYGIGLAASVLSPPIPS